jgi:hypothetical protein
LKRREKEKQREKEPSSEMARPHKVPLYERSCTSAYVPGCSVAEAGFEKLFAFFFCFFVFFFVFPL